MRTGRDAGWGVLVAAESFSAAVGFAVLIRFARLLGPEAFSAVEYAGAVAGVALVVVRGGVETIAHREAARRPRLIAPMTEALVLVKLALAAIATGGIALLGIAGGRASILCAGGLLLIPSALCLDVGPRALGRFGPLSAVQATRSLGLVVAAFVLVTGPGDALGAASCAAVAECAAFAAFAAIHVRAFGMPRLRLRLKAASCLAARGSVASLCRFGRVFLYAADVLALGAMTAGAGPYAAGRRIVFAAVGIGIVVPSALGPLLASAWKDSGPDGAGALLARSTARLLGPSLAVAIGLMLTAGGWMPTLFGPAYRDGSATMAVIAARLPLVLLAATVGSALVALKRERESLRIVGLSCALAVVSVPISVRLFGVMGAGVAMMGVELFAAAAGWRALARLGAAPQFPTIDAADLLGMLAMAVAVIAVRDRSVFAATALGASAFLVVRLLSGRAWTLRAMPPAEAAR